MIFNRKRWVCIFVIFAMAVSLVAAASILTTENTKAASKKTYLIKVNKKRNVVTAYKREKVDGKYKYIPIRAMLVSCGRATNSVNDTPSGKFKVKKKHKWGALYGYVWGRYTVQFYKDYLFHTVPYKKYKKPSSMFVGEYRKLGKKASGGCVRMQFIDEKWLSKTCPKGTKVIVYSSKKAGPLGRPKAATFNKKAKKKLAKGTYYDPTDPAKKNKGYNLAAPVISVPLGKTVQEGTVFNPLKGVTAKDKRSFQDLTDKINCVIYKRTEIKKDPEEQNPDGQNPEESNAKENSSKESTAKANEKAQGGETPEPEPEPEYKWERVDSVDTSTPGDVYMIKYSCYYKYCSKYTGKRTRYITILEKDPEENTEENQEGNTGNE